MMGQPQLHESEAILNNVRPCLKKQTSWAGKMAQGIKDPLAKTDELSLVAGEKVLSRLLFSDLHMPTVACMCPHGQTPN